MKILITGAHGQLGRDCHEVLGDTHDVQAMSSRELDITDREAAIDIVGRNAPDIVLNCGAYTNVDACETERELAVRVNAYGPENLSIAINETGGKLVHISTDYVFDGQKVLPDLYMENDPTNPLSYYGMTKLEGEKAVADIAKRHLIIRTAWVYGIHGHNFLKTMLKIALSSPDQKVRVVNDQFGSPTWTYRLAKQIKKLIEADESGLYHATAEGYCTWYDLAIYFLNKMGVKHNILPCGTAEYPVNAVRPMNSVLENKKLKEKNINIMARWDKDIDLFVENHKDRLISELERATK